MRQVSQESKKIGGLGWEAGTNVLSGQIGNSGFAGQHEGLGAAPDVKLTEDGGHLVTLLVECGQSAREYGGPMLRSRRLRLILAGAD